MYLWKKLALLSLIVSLLTFVALFGRLPALRKGPVGYLNRLLLVQLPGVLYALDFRVTGGRLYSTFAQTGYYLMNRNHPLILGFFVGLVSVSQVLFIPAAFPYLSHLERALALLLSIVPYTFIYACVTSTSSVITLDNHSIRMRQYPYDHVLFQPGHMCSTCRFLKPARSKHCSICNACVSKHDHHCIWVMNCLGKGNYGYFVAMLLTVSMMLTYGAWLGYGILTRFLQEYAVKAMDGSTTSDYWSTGTTWSQYFNLWSWALAQDVRIGAVGLLALLTAPLGWALFLYQVYLTWAGMTTNESSKWEDWKDDVQDGIVWRSEKARETNDSEIDPVVEPIVQWPAFSNQQLLRCEDGRFPDGLGMEHDHHGNFAAIATRQQVRWRRVQSMQEVENLYDLGFLDNLRDVFPFT